MQTVITAIFFLAALVLLLATVLAPRVSDLQKSAAALSTLFSVASLALDGHLPAAGARLQWLAAQL